MQSRYSQQGHPQYLDPNSRTNSYPHVNTHPYHHHHQNNINFATKDSKV